MKNLLYSLLASMVLFSSCDDDEPTPAPSATFTVTVENVITPKSFAMSGVFNTPVGDTAPGAATPGKAYSFAFNAGKGSYLSFATMFVQSNDLFYGTATGGMALYNDQGMAMTGDITSAVQLWDAGTEVNEEPGVGMNQPPRQSGANTGTNEMGNVVLVSNVSDGFTYPTTIETIKVMMAHDGGTMFTVTIMNISDQGSFMTPLAPGVFAIHGMGGGLYSEGAAAMNGLEGLAEDGDPSGLGSYTGDNTGLMTPYAPGVYAVHSANEMMFVSGASATAGIEALSEDGDPSVWSAELTDAGITNAAFSMPVGGSGAAPIFPGESYSFTFTAEEGDYLNLATMFIQSNDLFYSFGTSGIALFSNETPISGDMTGSIMLWDAGTEVNEYPGAGNNQAPRQSGANTGTDEGGNVMLVNDSFTYPMASSAIKVTISSVAL